MEQPPSKAYYPTPPLVIVRHGCQPDRVNHLPPTSFVSITHSKGEETFRGWQLIYLNCGYNEEHKRVSPSQKKP